MLQRRTSDINGFIDKVRKASEIVGTAYIHVISPCPTGWGIKTDETVEIAKEIVDCGLWYLAEYENGEFIINKKPKVFSFNPFNNILCSRDFSIQIDMDLRK